MNREEDGMDLFSGFHSALGKRCPSCHEMNPSDGSHCENCGHLLDHEEEYEEGDFSFVHEEGITSSREYEKDYVKFDAQKLPLDNSRFIALLKDCIERGQTAEITYDEYIDQVEEVREKAFDGLELLESRDFRHILETVSAADKKILSRLIQAFEKFLDGCEEMLEYDGGNDGSHAVKGFYRLEAGIREIDKIKEDVRRILKDIKTK